MKEKINSRFSFIKHTIILFIVLSALTRTTLLVTSLSMIDTNIVELFKIFVVGFVYDLVSISYFLIPFILYLLLVPKKIFQHKYNRYLIYIFIYILLFISVFYSFSEWFFWDEFGVRFNFIAVDYLIYTTEVIGNIQESYPMGTLISIIIFISSLLFYFVLKGKYIENIILDDSTFNSRLKSAMAYLLIVSSILYLGSLDISNISKNKFNNELSKSGIHSFVSAFINNTLDYDKFYITLDEKKVLSSLKELLLIQDTKKEDLTHKILKEGEEKDYNVMMIVVESLSGKYLKALGGVKDLTPNLDELSKKSLFFSEFYATGTRTVRGMESITLSLPPIPGRSIVKRPDNHNMYSSGFLFRDKGYDTKFIYGGYGYFDNMNDFFSNNGFSVVDRNNFTKQEDTFHTVWGVCDEDLLDKTLKEADESYKQHKPFMNFVMTTSNHRPYDYPNGKIEIPSHSGRDGSVKYTDYAIGDFIKKAKEKPWFKNTLFVIVADHCASSAGKSEIPLDKYHIPLLIYAPEIIQAKTIKKLSSQIDVMPTLLGLLNWSYQSKFYGKDILSDSFKQRAFVGTYQKLGLYKDNILTILSPGEKIESNKIIQKNLFYTKYEDIETSKELKNEIVSYYQGASILHKKSLDRYAPN